MSAGNYATVMNKLNFAFDQQLWVVKGGVIFNCIKELNINVHVIDALIAAKGKYFRSKVTYIIFFTLKKVLLCGMKVKYFMSRRLFKGA